MSNPATPIKELPGLDFAILSDVKDFPYGPSFDASLEPVRNNLQFSSDWAMMLIHSKVEERKIYGPHATIKEKTKAGHFNKDLGMQLVHTIELTLQTIGPDGHWKKYGAHSLGYPNPVLSFSSSGLLNGVSYIEETEPGKKMLEEYLTSAKQSKKFVLIGTNSDKVSGSSSAAKSYKFIHPPNELATAMIGLHNSGMAALRAGIFSMGLDYFIAIADKYVQPRTIGFTYPDYRQH